MINLKVQPNLNDLLNLFKRNLLNELNCINIGIIESFDTANQTAKIQLTIKKVTEIKLDGTKVLKERAALAQVPCIILGGAHNVRVPILQGDIALVFFNDKDIENWFLANSGLPNTLRTHDLSDGIAITGLHNISNAISDYLNDRITLYWDSNNRVEVLQDLVNIITTLCKITGKLEVTGDTKLDSKLDVTGKITGSSVVEGASLKADDGANATMIAKLPVQLTVKDGIVTSISY